MIATGRPLPDMPPLPGVRLATAESGTGYTGRSDMLLAALAPGSTVAGVLTRSSLPGAPVRWTRARLAEGTEPAALVVNAGNANVFTGRRGMNVVERTAARAGELLGCAPTQVLICSTGRIGQQLDPGAVETALGDLSAGLSDEGWHDAAHAIMTTDRWPKVVARRTQIGEAEVGLYGLAKGSTMIAPNMATTLSFLFTDAAIPAPVLQTALTQAANKTFNCIDVDNTTSTSDSQLLFATGRGATHPAIDRLTDSHFRAFRRSLEEVLHELSQAILEDARKDGKLLTISVSGARSAASARRIAEAVCHSRLARRVVATGELYLGRIIAAIGSSTEPVDPDALSIRIGDTVVSQAGEAVTANEAAAEACLSSSEIRIDIDVAVGRGRAVIATVVPNNWP